MKIHRLTTDHVDLLARATVQFRHRTDIDQAAFLADPATRVWVALADERIVGWVWGTRQRHVLGYTQFQLYEIEVVEEYRTRGIGRALVEAGFWWSLTY